MDTKEDNQPGVKAIDRAMSEIFADVKAIEKAKENKFFHFKFRGIDDVYAALHPLFAEHKVFLRVEILEHLTEDRNTKEGVTLHHIVKVRFSFRSGEDGSELSSVAIGEASDTGDKGATKAMSIALKYLMFQTFLIPVDNPADDADNDSPVFQGPASRSAAPAAPTAQKPSAGPSAPAKPANPGDTIIHFGKNRGARLCDLKAASVEWYAYDWELKSEASDEDRRLRKAAIDYLDELAASAPADDDNPKY
jgi:hypothetical protein